MTEDKWDKSHVEIKEKKQAEDISFSCMVLILPLRRHESEAWLSLIFDYVVDHLNLDTTCFSFAFFVEKTFDIIKTSFTLLHIPTGR